jgi:glycosyltransferase involved in cell wall biosynthesis
MALLQQHHPDARLEIIGDGPLRPNLERLAAELSVNASFRGVQSPFEVAQRMTRAQILCNPSIKASSGQMEGFGMVFAEAQAGGTPVVSFSNAAIPEVVSHGKTGLLCDEGDIGALASSLQTLLHDSTLWASMNRQGPVWVKERFDIVRQTDALERFYDDCVVSHRHVTSARSESMSHCAECPTDFQA